MSLVNPVLIQYSFEQRHILFMPNFATGLQIPLMFLDKLTKQFQFIKIRLCKMFPKILRRYGRIHLLCKLTKKLTLQIIHKLCQLSPRQLCLLFLYNIYITTIRSRSRCTCNIILFY